MVTGDPDAQDRICRALMEIFRADLPVTFLHPRVEAVVAHRRIQGLSSPWRAGTVGNMEDVWIDDESR